jgi:hypothetical protein
VAIAVLGGDFTAGQYPSGHILFSPNGNYNYTFPNVPYANETSAPFDNSIDEDDLVTFGSGAGYDVAADKGDICRYISSQGWVSGSWRMPRNSDFSTLIYTSAVTNGGFDQTLPTGTEAAYGRAQQIMGINFAAGLFMPASSRLLQVNPLYPNSYYIYAPEVGRRVVWMGASSWAGSLSDNNDPTKHFLVLNIVPSYAYSGITTGTAARALLALNVRCVKN